MMKYTTSPQWKLMLIVVVILVKDTISTTPPPGEIVILRRKRSNEASLNVDNIWQQTLLRNIPLMSQLAGQVIPPLSHRFLSSPKNALSQLLESKIADLIDNDEMLSAVLSFKLHKQMKTKLSEVVAEVAGDIKCTTDQIQNSPQMDAKATDFVIQILTEYDLLQLNKAPDCFVNNARYSGTDYVNGKIVEGIANSIQECQNSCIDEPECKFFIYFTKDHYQPEKQKVCRLLRFSGELQQDQEGHISGPKFCPDIFYPQVFAKMLRSWLLDLYPGYRMVDCNMEQVRKIGKMQIDQMYYLNQEERTSFMMNMKAKRCDLCLNDVCQDQETAGPDSVPMETKFSKFVNNLKAVSRNMSDLLTPLQYPGNFTDDEDLATLENNIETALLVTYNDKLETSILSKSDCVLEIENSIDGVEVQEGDIKTTKTTEGPSLIELDEVLPLCSELTTEAPKIGLGLLSKFGVTSSPAEVVPCRTGSEAGETTTIKLEAEESETTTVSSALFQQLSDKFG